MRINRISPRFHPRPLLVLVLVCLVLPGTQVLAVDYLQNGDFSNGLLNWTHVDLIDVTSRGTDAASFGAASPSLYNLTGAGNRVDFEWYDYQTISTPILSTDTVYLSLWWRKLANVSTRNSQADISIVLYKPSGATTILWNNANNLTQAGTPLTGEVTDSLVSAAFDEDGVYEIRLGAAVRTGRDNAASIQVNWDDVVLDVRQASANSAPTVTPGATQVSVTPVNRFSTNTTTISTTFSDADQPGPGAFTCTFRIRDQLSTEYALVSNQPDGGGGLVIADNGGGSYTASYVYDPGGTQPLDDYDLYFEVSDGTDNAIDPYASNLLELTIEEIIPNNAPTLSPGTTTVTPDSVNRFASGTTVISAAFSDSDQPGIEAFNCTFRIQDQTPTEYTLVNNEPNGGGGLVITDNGGGSYTASYLYDPLGSQPIDLYDLYFEVSDGVDNAIDDYAANSNELTIFQEATPALADSATAVTQSPVARSGANTTTLFCYFSDLDDPGVGGFTVTFAVRRPDNSTVDILAQDAANGAGVSIVDNGGGSYTAQYTWDPPSNQVLGLYDLYFSVFDGIDSVLDAYDNNQDELEVINEPIGVPPVVAAGATQVSVPSINRIGVNTTVISTSFSDGDVPGVGGFTCTFRVQDETLVPYTLVDNQPDGSGGLTITDDGGGNYTASFIYDPGNFQRLGDYDLYFSVSDGNQSATDDYANNSNELIVFSQSAPNVATGTTAASPVQVNRFGNGATTLSADFGDLDEQVVGDFTCTFRIRDDLGGELTLVNNQPDGGGGLTITDNGGGSFTASYLYDPDDAQALGFYDLFFEVNDGTFAVADDYGNNDNELEIIEVIVNAPPVLADSITTALPPSVDRVGANATTLSATFTDTDEPGIGGFWVTFKVRSPFNASIIAIVDSLQEGQGGLSIVDNGGGSYTASANWDPPDDATLGYYDLLCSVSDGDSSGVDAFDNNPDELLISNGGENIPPVVPSDATFATPAGIERVGANVTVVSATFSDADSPGINAFRVSFKLRLPDNSSELILADSVTNGTGGVTITDGGSGIYTASIGWDPPDAQALGSYDLYFQVTDGVDLSIDAYDNNLDELAVIDAITNNPPTITAGVTFVLPDTVNRIGSGFTMIKSSFSDVDEPSSGSFTITIRVRDNSSTEYTLVNAAQNGQQGLRVTNISGPDYEAAMLWDPDVAQATGPYDLYFSVQDADLASAVDDYANNTDELEVISAALLGDGHLLRRTNDASTCGGPNAACHNLPDHMGQDCRACHTPHGTPNIYLVRDTILTPSSGPREVDFRTLGIGDPYNDPDPTPGVFAGVMADSTDNIFTGVCEVCHTSTGHHRNDGSQPGPNHHDAENCSSCHSHAEGFPNLDPGGGEGSGGDGCGCHSALASPMKSTSGSYHHMILSEAGDYNVSSRTCLMCHVNHDIFRPDLNTGFGQRARNLRVDITTPVVQGDASVLTNTDYRSTGTGGICLSCHTSTQTKTTTPPDGSTETKPISKADYDAATSTHNYVATSSFSDDGSTFQANCVKCHNDTMSKSYQSAGNQFGTHDSQYGRLLDPFGASSPADPLEEDLCFGCHSVTNNPNAGSNSDYFGVQTMSTAALNVATALGYTYAHPVTSFRGRHKSDEVAGDLADGATRHAECADCHSVHASLQGTHDGSTNMVSNALKGAWGVEPTSWPAAPTPADNANVFAAPSAYNRIEPAQREYQICLKCHSNYTTLPAGVRNLAEEINPNYPSSHGIVQPGDNSFCNTSTMKEPWASSKIAWCSDCHRSSNTSDPEGPHGSNLEHLLVATPVSDDAIGTPLCYVCHLETVYWSDRSAGASSRFGKHPSVQGAHAVSNGCFSCHMWDYASTGGLGLQTTDDLAAGTIHVHGQNRRYIFNERDGLAGSGDSTVSFINGYIANIDYAAKECWAETCKDHSPQSY